MVNLYFVILNFFFLTHVKSSNKPNYLYSLSVLLKKPSWRSRTNNNPSLSNLLDGCCANVIISCLLKRISFVRPKNKSTRKSVYGINDSQPCLLCVHLFSSCPN